VDIPQDLHYTQDHEWAQIEGDVVTVGITEYAIEELGHVVYIELPAVDDDIDQEAVFGTVESVKAVAELFAPVSGRIVEVNEELLDAPETVNEDPYGDAWMVRIKATDDDELKGLMSADAYQSYLDELT